MSVVTEGFKIIDLPPAGQELLDSYDNCPLDEYMGNQTRYKRFSQYRLAHSEDRGWQFELLPHRAYTAFKKFNPIGGGISRPHPPLEADLTPYVRLGVAGLELDTSEDWQINVHQNRTRATVEKPGLLTPEGVHQDGHEFVMIGVLRRHSVVGGETRLWRLGADEPFWTGTLQAGQAVLLDDRAVAHDVTDVLPENGQAGHRDILIVAFSRWKEKWYGEEHDAAVLAGGEPVVDTSM
ncbi:2OG-Fe dioxygenase family protein [Micromonospora sp. SH-82]|uniref:2OG-Fe dioxygenase family protein n=1 Tax=Micromonospora sp. SH-82 TaxID=3132938 RepID=UPI003EB72007